TADVMVVNRDETGKIAQSLRAMLEKLRRLLGEIINASENVASSAIQISASSEQIAKRAESESVATEQTSSIMMELVAQIGQLANNAESLSISAQNTAAAILQMNRRLVLTADNGDQLLHSLNETSTMLLQMTENIRGVATRVRMVEEVSKRSVADVRSGSKELAGAINAIGKRTKSIGKIIKTIEDIADQTNLLALNAAIEAARAGQGAEGFAVVADEVRKLAERSVNATQEISGVIEDIQEQTADAIKLSEQVLTGIVSSVDETSQLVAETVGATEKQAVDTKLMMATSTSMSSLIEQIAAITKENAKGAEEISKATNNVSSFVQEINCATREQQSAIEMAMKAVSSLASVSKHNLSSVEEVVESTRGLAKESAMLKNLVEVFRLPL
ncbi:MAG: methyl-accepting chemotaxis protein, partial [Acidobacteriota bacterium]